MRRNAARHGTTIVIGLLGGAALLCILVAALTIVARPRQFTNHRDQIGDALARRGVAFDAIYVTQGWPDQINSQTYGANVQVDLSTTRHVFGRVECRQGKTRCWFAVERLGVERQELADLTIVHRSDWQEWVDALATRLGLQR